MCNISSGGIPSVALKVSFWAGNPPKRRNLFIYRPSGDEGRQFCNCLIYWYNYTVDIRICNLPELVYFRHNPTQTGRYFKFCLKNQISNGIVNTGTRSVSDTIIQDFAKNVYPTMVGFLTDTPIFRGISSKNTGIPPIEDAFGGKDNQIMPQFLLSEN